MSRQGPYRDAYSESQRMQQNAGMSNFPGRLDSFPPEQGNPYVSSQWDRDGPRRTPSSHPYSEARHGGTAAHQSHISEPKVDLENEANKRPRYQTQEQDMEIGYEDKPSLLTFEVLEQKFQDEILKLLKEQSDAEDAEIVRHRERIVDINSQYQEKLVSLRARQTNRREEFLRKESERRLQHYQQAGLSNPLITTVSNDLHSHAGPGPLAVEAAHRAYPSAKTDYDSVAMEGRRAYPGVKTDYDSVRAGAGPVAMEAHRAYSSVKTDYDSVRAGAGSVMMEEAHRAYPHTRSDYEREPPPPYHGGGKSQGTEGRVPMPAGRVYNNASARYG